MIIVANSPLQHRCEQLRRNIPSVASGAFLERIAAGYFAASGENVG